MKEKDYLFRLIQSLSPAEKSYLRKYAEIWKKGEKKYWRLFELISKQKVYDESLACELWSKGKGGKDFAVAKHKLFRLILRSLRGFHSRSHLTFELREQLDAAEILFRRGLLEAAYKTIRTTKKRALTYDAFFVNGELLRLETQVVKALGGKFQNSRLESIQEESEANRTKIQSEAELSQLRNEMFSLFSRETQVRTPQNKARIEAIMQHPVISNTKLPSFFNARMAYLIIHAFNARLLGKIREFQNRTQQILQIWDASPHRIRQEPSRYFLALASFLDICLHNADFHNFELYARQLSAPDLVKRIDPSLYFQTSLQLKLQFALNKKEWADARELHHQLKSGLVRHGEGIQENYKLPLMYNAMVLTFLDGQNDLSMHWVLNIMNNPETVLRKDIVYASRIFFILLHFEWDDIDELELGLSRYSRFFHRKGEWFAYEQSVIRNLRKVSTATPGTALDHWRAFQRELEQGGFVGQLGYQELLGYIDAKVSGLK